MSYTVKIKRKDAERMEVGGGRRKKQKQKNNQILVRVGRIGLCLTEGKQNENRFRQINIADIGYTRSIYAKLKKQ